MGDNGVTVWPSIQHSTLVKSSAGPNPNQVGAGAEVEVGIPTVRTLDAMTAMYRSAKAGRAEAC